MTQQLNLVAYTLRAPNFIPTENYILMFNDYDNKKIDNRCQRDITVVRFLPCMDPSLVLIWHSMWSSSPGNHASSGVRQKLSALPGMTPRENNLESVQWSRNRLLIKTIVQIYNELLLLHAICTVQIKLQAIMLSLPEGETDSEWYLHM